MHITCPVQSLGNREHLISNYDYYSLLLFLFSIFLGGTTKIILMKNRTMVLDIRHLKIHFKYPDSSYVKAFA